MTTYNKHRINYDYDFFMKIIFLLFTIDIFLRIINYDFASALETLSIILLICIVIFNLLFVGDKKIQIKSAMYIFFILYLLINILFSYLYRIFVNNVSPANLILAIFYQFRLSVIGFLFFVIFFYIKNNYKFEKFIINLLKIGVLYTIFEQIASLIGFRDFFQKIYIRAGVVTSNLINLKELGLYRVWGLVGSTELLGVYNLILFAFLIFDENIDEKKTTKYLSLIWILLSFCAVIFSTSKTAYIILLFLLFILIIIKKNNKIIKYCLILFSLLIFLILLWLNRNNIILINFYLGTVFYFTDLVLRYHMNRIINNSLHKMNLSLILHILFGRGLTFGFKIKNLFPYAHTLDRYKDIPEVNHFFLSFIDQYGLFGYFLFIYLFFIKPIISIYNKVFIKYNAMLIILFLAFFHYPVLPSKLIVLYISYAIFIVYFSKNQIEYAK